VAALNVRSEADAMARRLTAKGYTAYVVAPASGTPAVFRVRVGSYKTRREAEAMAARLQKEEQIKPWVTRSTTRERSFQAFSSRSAFRPSISHCCRGLR
jgi:cell division septation protein DedD